MTLAFHDVTAGYGDTIVLRNVDLVVPDACVVALLGPNGAGKTTFLRTASGLLKPQRGKILFNGRDISGDRPEERARQGLCLIPEGRAVFPTLTVAENLRLFGGSAATERALDAFPKLGTRLHQLVGTMSGGEQQMVALARAYLVDAQFVLLDEVSMGLAPKIVEEVFEFIDRLRLEGRSLVLVEQYVTKALAIADYVYLLNRGQVAFAGEPAEVDGDRLFAEYVGGAA